MIGPFRGLNKEAILTSQRRSQLLRCQQFAIGHQIEMDQGVVQHRSELMEVFDTLNERRKVVDSLPGYTSGMAGCRHNLVTRTTCSMRLSVSTDGTIRPLQRPLVGDCSLKRL